MCYKQFLGYSCGHCSLPEAILCPLTTQDPSFSPCPIMAERGVHLDRLCTVCHRAQFKINRIQFENEHTLKHELGHCSLSQCGTAYTVEERKIIREQDEAAKAKKLQCRQAHQNEQQKDVEVSFALKRAVDASAQNPQVSAHYGMVSELDVTSTIEAPGLSYQAAPAIMDKPDTYNEASGPSYQFAPASDPLPMTASNAPRGGGNHRWNDARRNYHGNGGRFQRDPYQQDPYQQDRNQHGRHQQGRNQQGRNQQGRVNKAGGGEETYVPWNPETSKGAFPGSGPKHPHRKILPSPVELLSTGHGRVENPSGNNGATQQSLQHMFSNQNVFLV